MECQDHLETFQAVVGLLLDVDDPKNCKRAKK